MINRYSDHAANERTFLAWVRTAVAVMAFGFLVVKFDLFIQVTARSLAGRAPPAVTQLAGNAAGLLLVVLGAAMMAVATLRFRRTARDIDAPDPRPSFGTGMDVALVLLLLGLGAVLFAFLLYTALRGLG